jgi:hypothetical protein
MMTAMELPIFTRTDCAYIKEYCKVTGPIAKALDQLQGEANAYFGTLLPTIWMATKQLQNMIDTRGELLYCKDLAKALMAGLKTRFQHLQNDEKCQLAAAFHPVFRTLPWLAEEKRAGLKKKMQDLIAEDLKKRVEKAPLTSAEVTHNDDAGTSAELIDVVPEFWQSMYETTNAKARRDLYDVNATKIVDDWTKTFTRSRTLHDSDFMREPSLIDLFIKYNTPVPSSAAVERLFSQSGDILRPKRSCLKAERFNHLNFLRGNRHHWDTYKEA